MSRPYRVHVAGVTDENDGYECLPVRLAFGVPVNRRLRALAVVAVLALGATSASLAVAPNAQAAPAAIASTRLAGDDRYATSAAISAASFKQGVAVAYVASGRDFPDALSGAAAAGTQGAPVLLTAPTALPEVVRAELVRLRPKTIVVLGGEGAVSQAVHESLQTLTTGAVTRLAGTDRYATSAAVSAATFPPDVAVAYVATGRGFADALSGAAAAGAKGAPLLLVPGSSVTAETRAELARLSPDRIVVLGSTGAVSASVEAELATIAPTVDRLGGADRYATSAAVSADSFPAGVPAAYLASGLDFPDALAGAPVAGLVGGPVLLLPATIPAAMRIEITRLSPGKVVVLGGLGAVSTAVVQQAVGLDEIGRIAAAYTAPPPSKGAGAKALAWAHTQLGVPYKWAGTGPDTGGYDCSGLVMKAYEAAGVPLTRTTRQQWASTTRVALDDLQPGDIVFWSSNGQLSGIYHNALYAGKDPVTGKSMRLQAPSPGKFVELVPMLEANLLPFGGRIG
ncbi:hypothetical protein FJ693_07555 [Georgenia yuyongxinii]|uniref:NlpC/P60 domain-containing protein n=1 Tax=Georgenia yuyongxinii TaxID=2589797 RepID=A0A552WSP3_9MICO|nr:hypothetical protein FJ693_07555 [Georgenia yuyongxinii]